MKGRMVKMVHSGYDGIQCLVVKQKMPHATCSVTTSVQWQDGRYQSSGW